MQRGWLLFALLALFMWGLWGVFSKLATGYMRPQSVIVYHVAGVLGAGLAALALTGFRPETSPRGMLFAFLGGVTGSLGIVFFLLSIARQKASVVVTMTALYPLVTIALSFFILREAVTAKQALGMAFAILAMLFFSL